MTPYPEPGTPCSVCGEPLGPASGAFCDGCGEPFHLNQREDLPGKDCGRVWINEDHLGLEFACDRCLNPPSALEEVLELEEAAAFVGLAVAELEAAALAGQLPHRRTGSGILLFSRRELVAWMEARSGGA